jgi:myo-inositol catabolism protein IolC
MAGNPDWRPRHDDPLFILAMDHRESFGKTLFGVQDDDPDPAQAAAMRAAKHDLQIRPGLITRVIADNQAHGVEPALWKVEGLETVGAARQVAEAGGRATDLIVLGRDAPAERLDHWLEVASQVDAFVGFAIGRSIWEDVVREYEASDRGAGAAAEARGQIAERYLGFVAHWTP